MTGVLVFLGLGSIIYGVYLHLFHTSPAELKSTSPVKNNREQAKPDHSIDIDKKELQRGVQKKAVGKKAYEKIATETTAEEKNPKRESTVKFAEVLRKNLSTEELQKDTLEKLKKQAISLEEAAKIMDMDKGEVLLLKNIYVNYQE